jgi:hypothetical protein
MQYPNNPQIFKYIPTATAFCESNRNINGNVFPRIFDALNLDMPSDRDDGKTPIDTKINHSQVHFYKPMMLLTLDKAEAEAIEAYSDCATPMNEFLRRITVPKINLKLEEQIKNILGGVEKIIKHHPLEIRKVFRLTDGGERNAVEGKIFSDKGFLSTTADHEVIPVASDNAILYTIFGNPANIARYARYPSEKEHLYPPNTEFNVLLSVPAGRDGNGRRVVLEQKGLSEPKKGAKPDITPGLSWTPRGSRRPGSSQPITRSAGQER